MDKSNSGKLILEDPGASEKTHSLNIDDILLNALDGSIPKIRPLFRYKVALVLVSFAMILLPLLYISLVCSVLYLLTWHISHNLEWFTTIKSAHAAFLLYIIPIIIGGLVILFMVKPFFVPRFKVAPPLKLDRDSQPLLFRFVDKLSHLIGSPSPKEIYIDTNPNAYASLKQNLLSIFRKDLILTVGLPFASGMNINQFTGVLAHELGHFSQSAGMRLSYLIRLINLWFEWVVFEEDVWDRRLHRWTQALDIRLSFILIIAKYLILGTRKILWVLMKAGHGIGCYMLRQMEYDADRHEIAISGSSTFESTSRRIVMLSHAFHWAIQDLQNSWADNNRLVDNFPALIVSKANTIPGDIKKKILQDFLVTRKTGFFDTHPSDADRIARANQLNIPPLFRIDRSKLQGIGIATAECSEHYPKASILFREFEALSRKTSMEYYRNVLGNQVSSEHIINIQDITSRHHTENECSLALMRFFNSQFNVIRPFGFTKEPIPILTDPESHIKRIIRCRKTIQTTDKKYHQVITQHNRLYERINLILKARTLLDAGIPIRPKEFNLVSEDEETIKDALSRAESELKISENALSLFEKNNYLLLKDAIALLGCDAIMANIENARQLKLAAERFITTLCVMESNFRELFILETSGRQLNYLAAHLENREDSHTLNHQIEEEITIVRENLQIIKPPLDNIPYPFDHSQADLTMGDFVLPFIPSRDELGALIQSAFNTVDIMFRIYARIAARLAYIAEIAEKAAYLYSAPKDSDPPVIPVSLNIFSDFSTKGKITHTEKSGEEDHSRLFEKLLAQIRSGFGPPPRSFSWLQKHFNHIRKPLRMTLIRDARFNCIYKNQEHLLKHGKIVWGTIVQANHHLFEPGGSSCPAVAAFSLDPFFERHLTELDTIALNIYELKQSDTYDERLSAFMETVVNDYDAYFNLPVPPPLSQGREIYLSVIMIHRKHLPVDHIVSGWMPLLVDPEKTDASMVLPAKYWGDEAVMAWCRG